MQRILLLGNTGQLGWELHRAMLPLGEVSVLDWPRLDFSNFDQLREQVRIAKPDIVINAVAYTAVDQAEVQPELTMTINSAAPGLLAELARELSAVLVHYSTDYVFDGEKGAPYVETDAPHPLGVYAASKLAGDQAIEAVGGSYVILRSSWIYSSRRDNFVKKVLGWARSKTELSVVDDQVGCPTWARSLAETTALMFARAGDNLLYPWMGERRGVYHLANGGYTSRYSWAEKILQLDSHPEQQTIQTLQRAKTADFPTPAKRPLFTPLECGRFRATFDLAMSDWETALTLAMAELAG